MLVGDRLGQLVHVGVDQLPEGEHHLGALAQRGLGPLREGRLGRGHGGVDVGGLGQQHLRLLLPRGRVPHRSAAGGDAGGLLVVDPVLDGAHLGALLGGSWLVQQGALRLLVLLVGLAGLPGRVERGDLRHRHVPPGLAVG